VAHLGFDRFHLVGHDLSGRTTYRLVLDTPSAVQSLTAMDIIPIHQLLSAPTREVKRASYHWFFLAQSPPFPEAMIANDPDAYFENNLLGWGLTKIIDFDTVAQNACRTALRRPVTIKGMFADYWETLDVHFAGFCG
jgi:haloacetate dehalogenase